MTRKSQATTKRRPVPRITLGRASRLHRLVRLLAAASRSREALLSQLGIGIRTFYRELELLKRCGVRVRHRDRVYELLVDVEEAEARLPFPDPQLSFAEMAELAGYPGEASKRLAELLRRVTSDPEPSERKRRAKRKRPETS